MDIPKKPRKLSNAQVIISRLVADMRGCYDKTLWGRETRLVTKLIKVYGLDFMLWVQPPEGKKVSSLMTFLSVFGKNYLSDQLVEFKKVNTNLTTEQKEILLSPTKIGDDVVIEKKPQTLKEFLNYGKTRQQTGEREESSPNTTGTVTNLLGS